MTPFRWRVWHNAAFVFIVGLSWCCWSIWTEHEHDISPRQLSTLPVLLAIFWNDISWARFETIHTQVVHLSSGAAGIFGLLYSSSSAAYAMVVGRKAADEPNTKIRPNLRVAFVSASAMPLGWALRDILPNAQSAAETAAAQTSSRDRYALDRGTRETIHWQSTFALSSVRFKTLDVHYVKARCASTSSSSTLPSASAWF